MNLMEEAIECGTCSGLRCPPARDTRPGGSHYAVVVSDEPYNWLSTVVVVPLSSGAQESEMHPEFPFQGARTRALVEQVTALDKRYLREKVGSLAGTATMDVVEERLRYLLALDH